MPAPAGQLEASGVAIARLRPKLYDDANQRRSEHLQVRRRMLLEDFESELVEWMEDTVGGDVVDVWGPPDTALNPLASSTRQLVTPGLYGRRPSVTAPAGGDALTGTGGYMDRARMWSRAQRLQYLVVGAGIWLRRVAVSVVGDEASLVDWLVNPADVVVFVDESNPQHVVAIWHLRQRKARLAEGGEECFYAWDVWELRADGTGSCTVHRAEQEGGLGEDVSDLFLTLAEPGKPAYRGPLTGETYPWKDPTGRAYLPWVIYRAEESEEFWPSWRKGTHRGTLRACAHWTYTSRSALFATGEHVILAGPDPQSLPTEHRLQPTPNGATGATELAQVGAPQTTMRFHPGTITVLPMEGGKQLQSVSIGPGVNLPVLSAFAAQYQMTLAMGDGLHPTDATRQSANPSSGVSLEIQASSRREFSAQVLPLFRDSDLELIRKCAWLLASVGVSVPAEGYSVEYHTIPLSPTEQEDLRADLEWQEGHGQISPIDVHLRLHPGTTREQALAAIVNARADVAEIDALVEAELVRRGVRPAEDEDEETETDEATPDEPAERDTPASDTGTPLASTALNGAQVTAALEIVGQVAQGQLPRETAVSMLVEFFQLPRDAAERVLGTVGKSFTPEPPANAPPPAK